MPDKVNIYLGLYSNFEKCIFPNSNKIATEVQKKYLFDFNISLQYSLYFGEVILSPLIYFNMKYFRRQK